MPESEQWDAIDSKLVCADAGEIIHTLVAVMTGNMDVRQVAGVFRSIPPSVS